MPETSETPNLPFRSRLGCGSALVIGLLIGFFVGELRNRGLRREIQRLKIECEGLHSHWTDDGRTLEAKLAAIDAFNEGNALTRTRKFLEAIACYSKAIELNPGFAEAYANRGVAYVKSGQFDEAVADYNEAIRLEPTRATTYYNRGIAYVEKGEAKKAAADFAKAEQLGYTAER